MSFTDFPGSEGGPEADALEAALDDIRDVLGAMVTGLSPCGNWAVSGRFPPDATRGDDL